MSLRVIGEAVVGVVVAVSGVVVVAAAAAEV